MSDRQEGQLHLNYFHGYSGQHEAAWRHPASDPRRALTLDYLVEVAQIAEAGCLDSIFFPHGLAAQGLEHTDFGLHMDPVLVLASIAAATSRIGLIATASTTFSQPFDLAQRFATLDHLSSGRAGWNIVTSSTNAGARNFGAYEMPEHDARYARASEFVDICKRLWDSWEPGAWVVDKAAGVYADPARVHPIEHVGEHYSVEGPMCMPPSPQRHPLLAQAGASDAGRDFAARHAEAIFTITPTIEEAIAFAGDIRDRARAAGHGENAIRILPGLGPILGPTESAARRKEKELADLVMPERGLGILSAYTHVDFSGYPLDGPVPALPDVAGFKGGQARLKLVSEYVRREQPTVRQLAGWFSTSGLRGHGAFVGTYEQLADRMEEWFRRGAADGFNLLSLQMPEDLIEFTREVVPILQERGLFRTEYAGTTLRDHYGLPAAAASGDYRS